MNLPFSHRCFTFTALDLPVKGCLEETLYPRIHHEQQWHSKYRSFPLTWKVKTCQSSNTLTRSDAHSYSRWFLKTYLWMGIKINFRYHIRIAIACLAFIFIIPIHPFALTSCIFQIWYIVIIWLQQAEQNPRFACPDLCLSDTIRW